jgi:biofilm PGA synthesis lipoprotein PgaB
LPTAEKQLRESADNRMRWAKHKTQALIEWTHYLADIVRKYHPDIKTARNYYALPILQPDSEEWYAQSLVSGLDNYDYIAVEAMPFMEKADDPDKWLKQLVGKVSTHPKGLSKTVFELQTLDWSTQKKIPMGVFLEQLKLVQKLGAIHVGYYPDMLFDDHPHQLDMENAFALPRYP